MTNSSIWPQKVANCGRRELSEDLTIHFASFNPTPCRVPHVMNSYPLLYLSLSQRIVFMPSIIRFFAAPSPKSSLPLLNQCFPISEPVKHHFLCALPCLCEGTSNIFMRYLGAHRCGKYINGRLAQGQVFFTSRL